MAVTVFATGSQAATVGTEHTLTGVNEAGTYTLDLDTVNMLSKDVVEIRVYKMTVASGSSRVLFVQVYSGAQFTDDLIKISVPVSNGLTDTNALKFTLKQVYDSVNGASGAGKSFPWSVLKHA